MEQRRSRDERARAARSVSAIASVFDAHVDEVYRFLHRRCRDHALAEDITQETFLTAIRRGDDPGSITVGWLITVARNRLVDVLRREAGHEGKLRLVVGCGRSSEPDAELVERLRVEGALNKLRVEHRVVLTLHYIDGLTVPALADQLGRSVKSIEGLVTRARRELRDLLDADTTDKERTGGAHG